jgi:hypothetical protein
VIVVALQGTAIFNRRPQNGGFKPPLLGAAKPLLIPST